MMYPVIAKVKYYDYFDGETKEVSCFTFAETYSEACKKLTFQYGELNINKMEIEMFEEGALIELPVDTICSIRELIDHN